MKNMLTRKIKFTNDDNDDDDYTRLRLRNWRLRRERTSENKSERESERARAVAESVKREFGIDALCWAPAQFLAMNRIHTD